jgi:hypothetical protein
MKYREAGAFKVFQNFPLERIEIEIHVVAP